LFIIVFFINLLIITKAPFKVAQDNNWIGFWGGVLGAVLSGIITFIVLRITIDNENKKRIKDMEVIESQRLEDKRMSVLPYLNYTIVDDKYIKENNIVKELETPISIDPKLDEDDLKELYGKVRNIDCKFNLLIENFGLGASIEPRLDTIYYDGLTITLMARNRTMLRLGDSSVMKFSVNYPKGKVCPMTLKIGYFNLIRDYYEQDIVVGFQGIPVFIKGKDGNIIETKMEYEPIIASISKPILVENYQDTNMTVEVSLSRD